MGKTEGKRLDADKFVVVLSFLYRVTTDKFVLETISKKYLLVKDSL